ncbi:hypothetical protein EG68_03187 [Paragonimus skrjabini miyazakii]|uniref:Uncharacterized protein n=1 Tax=Paragonimus skrjabini miyazakii TaxID=59628 RepID=A0A8S9YAZ9_9TREM|nr:hypothetical protein EG68_03187 [Paragonimus skrjabini miyazakii]
MNPTSNIRPVHFWSNCRLTELQQRYCAFYEDTWKWLDSYWAYHNVNFQQAKRSFLESRAPVGSGVRLDASADLSEFYSRFLKENQHTQLRFNFEWYRRIAYISYLGILVDLQHGHVKEEKQLIGPFELSTLTFYEMSIWFRRTAGACHLVYILHWKLSKIHLRVVHLSSFLCNCFALIS